jgi:hypothetical protein
MTRRLGTRHTLLAAAAVAVAMTFGLSSCAASGDSTAAAMHESVVQISTRAAEGDFPGALAELALLERDVDAAVEDGAVDTAQESDIRAAIDQVRTDLEAADAASTPSPTVTPAPAPAPAEDDDPPGNDDNKGKGNNNGNDDKGKDGKGEG